MEDTEDKKPSEGTVLTSRGEAALCACLLRHSHQATLAENLYGQMKGEVGVLVTLLAPEAVPPRIFFSSY